MGKQPQLPHACSACGANFGRPNMYPHPRDRACTLRLARLKMDGDYDAGGAYWGSGPPAMWVAWSKGGVRVFARGTTREDAKRVVKGLVPGAKFYK